MEDLKYPEWQKPLQEAILEFDIVRLPERIAEAEAAIFVRQLALANSPDGHSERDAIRDGLRILSALKKDKLKFPDWHSEQRSRA